MKPNDPDPECQALCAWVDRKLASGALGLHHRASHYHRRSSLDTDIYYDVIIGRKA